MSGPDPSVEETAILMLLRLEVALCEKCFFDLKNTTTNRNTNSLLHFLFM